MKYSKKQIKQAFLEWETDSRLTPSDFLTDQDKLKEDSVEIADRNAEALIKYMNK